MSFKKDMLPHVIKTFIGMVIAAVVYGVYNLVK